MTLSFSAGHQPSISQRPPSEEFTQAPVIIPMEERAIKREREREREREKEREREHD